MSATPEPYGTASAPLVGVSTVRPSEDFGTRLGLDPRAFFALLARGLPRPGASPLPAERFGAAERARTPAAIPSHALAGTPVKLLARTCA